MESKSICDLYERTKETFKFLAISSIRMKIMLRLNEGPKELDDLLQELDIKPPNLVSNISALRKENFVFKEGKIYDLTEKGEVAALQLTNWIKSAYVLKKHEKFWMNHDIGGIPKDLLAKIGDLDESNVVKAEPTDLDRVHVVFMDILSKAKRIRGISPIFHPDFPEAIENSVFNGVDVQLILTDEVLNAWTKASGQEIMDKLLSQKNFSLWIIENPKVAFTLTDGLISLGLFTMDGVYDYSNDLISGDKDAVRWGEELFKHYFKRAKRFK